MFETQGGTRNRTRDLPKKGSAFITSSDHWTFLDVCGASDVRCTGLSCCSLAVWVLSCWFVGGVECAVVFAVLGDAGPGGHTFDLCDSRIVVLYMECHPLHRRAAVSSPSLGVRLLPR